MSFLTEALSLTDSVGVENTYVKFPDVLEKIRTCKSNLHNCINDIQIKYRKLPRRNKQLLDTTKQLTNEIESLQIRLDNFQISQINKKAEEVKHLRNDLQESSAALQNITHLIKFHDLFVNTKEYLLQQEFAKAANELFNASNAIGSIPKEETTVLIEALKNKFVLEEKALKKLICELFDENVKKETSKYGNLQTNSIKIRKEPKILVDVLSVMGLFEIITKPLDEFCKFLWQNICKPILTKCALVKIDEEKGYYVLNIVIKKGNGKGNSYQCVFAELIEIFQYLYNSFNYNINKDLNTIDYISQKLQQDLFQAVMKECLADICQNINKDSEKYKRLIIDITKFQTKLIELKIVNINNDTILDYINNVDFLIINKVCEEFEIKAIALMKSDLHDMVKVGVPYDPNNPITDDEFPECSVSHSSIEIMEHTEEMLKLALNETNLAAGRIICSVQSIFFQYGNIAYGHHEKFLQNIPQQVVLYRNNCMYLAHRLGQLNKTHTKLFPKNVLPDPPLFKDQPHQLLTVGGDILLAYVEQHVATMEITLEEYKFVPQQLSECLDLDSDKCLRQCIRQYELLKTVWYKILPYGVYNKILAYLLNCFCKKLIDVVLEAPDISSKNAEHLVELFKIVLTRGPKLFTDSQDISVLVTSWKKLIDLVFILNSSLSEINDNWSNGTGPLVEHFTANEIKHLIKAIFQNTDRRAAVLNQI